MTPNKSRQQGRFAPGRLYSRPCLKRYVYRLNKVVWPIIISAALFAPTASADLQWFERKWISDADVSMTYNEGIVEAWTEEGRASFKSAYGKMEWHVDGGIVKVLIAGTELNSSYSYRPRKGSGYELLLEDGEVIPLERTSTGFCVEFKTPDSETGVITDCYRPLDET